METTIEGLGFGVLGFGFWFGAWGLGFGVWGLGLRVLGSGFRVQVFGFRSWGLGFRILRLRLEFGSDTSKTTICENKAINQYKSGSNSNKTSLGNAA